MRKRYEKYKDSGIEWIGEVPGHWEIKKLKQNSFIKGRIGWQGLRADEFIDEGPYIITGMHFKDGNVDWESCYHISEERYQQAPEIQIKEKDLLITKDGTIGKVAYIENLPGKASLNSHLLVIRPLNNEYVSKYLYWLLQSAVFDYYVNLSQTGTTFFGITQRKIEDFKLPIPFLKEQEKLVCFLDQKTSEIDSLIADKEKLIQRLQEYKQSVITEAVTKGLNPDVKMKDSGVEWIGEVPEHWKVVKLKYIGEAIIGLTYDPSELTSEENGILVLRASNLKKGQIVFEDNVYVNKEIPAKLRVKKHDIIICSRSGSKDLIGKCGMIDSKSIGCTFGAFLTVFRSKYNEFLFYVFQSQLFKSQIGSFFTTTINQLTIGSLNTLVIAFPPKNEQMQIKNYLFDKTVEINALISNIQSQIIKLKEYRQSLIYEAVTGKIDVRDYGRCKSYG